MTTTLPTALNTRLLLLLIPMLSLAGCGSQSSSSSDDEALYASDQVEPSIGDYVFTRITEDPKSLHPVNVNNATSQQIRDLMFQSLLAISPTSLKPVPALAADQPEISGDGMEMRYEIREEATWDNGDPVTGKDVLFTVKAILMPYTDAGHLRPYLDFIQRIEIDPSNPKRFTVIAERPYFRAIYSFGLQNILPRYHYDAGGALQDYSIAELKAMRPGSTPPPALKAFAETFNSAAFMRNPDKIAGSGPYRLESWRRNQSITLARKSDYWAEGLQHQALAAYPEKVIYKVIDDVNTAVAELKKGNIDILVHIPPRLFKEELQQNQSLKRHYDLVTTNSFNYGFLALNNLPPRGRTPYFTDRNVRWAFAHLLDVKQIIEQLRYGYAERITGPISPENDEAYNDTLQPVQHSLEKARRFLDKAGWKDRDGNGIREKTIGGRSVEFRPEIITFNPIKERTALLLKKECARVGIELKITNLKATALLERLKERDYDLTLVNFTTDSPIGGDLKQLWHRDMINAGTNWWGFGDAESDALIDQIRRTIDEEKRNHLIRRFQEILYHRQPVNFTYTTQNLIAVHKRFHNAKPTPLHPGIDIAGLWTPQEHVVNK